jgi:hypothetical protein
MATRSPRLRYHAVSVVGGSGVCEAAKLLKDVRLLSVDAPRLPLRNCEHPDTCNCRYRKYDDRRAGQRREDARVGLGVGQTMTERRRSFGRRETD